MANHRGEKKKGCRKCPYWKRPFVPAERNKDAQALLVVGAPWDDEVRKGRPMAGANGEKFDELVTPVGLNRNDFNITHCVKCKPPEDKNKEGSAEKIDKVARQLCKKLFLIPEIEKLKPNIVVPAGSEALLSVTNRSGIMNQHGFIFQQPLQNGDEKFKVKVLPIFAPNFIAINPQMTGLAVSDLRKVREQIGKKKIVKIKDKVDYKALENRKETLKLFKRLLSEDGGATDLEMTGLNHLEEDTLCAAFSPKKGRVSRVLNFYGKFPKKNAWAYNKKILKAFFKWLHSGRLIYGQNLKFDLRFIRKLFLKYLKKDIKIEKINFHELLLMSVLIDENVPKDLKTQAHSLTPIRYTQKEISVVENGNLKFEKVKRRTKYASKDSDATARIGPMLRKRLREEHKGVLWKLFKTHEMPLHKELFLMEHFGMHIERKRLMPLRKQIRTKLKEIRQEMYDMAGYKFSPTSGPQLRKVMFKKLKIKGSKEFLTKEGEFRTNKHHLQWLENNSPHPFLELLQIFQQYNRLDKGFIGRKGYWKETRKGKKWVEGKGVIQWMDENDIVHPNFRQDKIVTGRLAAEDPNVLNVPRDKEYRDKVKISVKRIFTARKGYVMIVADYSQIEFKMIALMANIVSILKELKKGGDFHVLTARGMFGKKMLKAEAIAKTGKWNGKAYSKKQQEEAAFKAAYYRQESKTFNFALVFQAGIAKLASMMNTTQEKAQKFMDQFFEKYPEIKRMMVACENMALTQGYVQLSNGRFRRFPKQTNRALMKRQARQAFNVLPQGEAGYVGREALLRICRRFRKEKIKGSPTNIVYDSIMAEAKKKHATKAAYIIADEMLKKQKRLNNFIFSIKIGYGHDWQKADKESFTMNTIKDFKSYKAFKKMIKQQMKKAA